MEHIGVPKLLELMPRIDADSIDRNTFLATGVAVVRGAVPCDVMASWQSAWAVFHADKLASGRNVNRFNPVAVDEKPPEPLASMHRHPALLDVVGQVFGPDLALFNQRFVVKDAYSRGPVFLHQDFPYHIGWPNKASLFVPLSVAGPENGGVTFYPGTHHFGYLGDAGEIDPSILPEVWPEFTPTLQPGDVALMNSLVWHRSGPHVRGPDRVLVDIIYQPADDPSGIALLRGKWRTDLFLDRRDKQLFVRSRVTRLVEMQRELDALKSSQRVPE